jgi:hypothetical protein
MSVSIKRTHAILPFFDIEVKYYKNPAKLILESSYKCSPYGGDKFCFIAVYLTPSVADRIA